MLKYGLKQVLNSSYVKYDRNRTIYSGSCSWCHKAFWTCRPFRVNRINKFCSQECKAYSDWDLKLKNGYRGCLDNMGYVRWKIGQRQLRAHRFVVEQALGRKLRKSEWVHHKNGDNADNRLKNLVIVSHADPHHEVKCPRCDYAFRIH